MEILGRDSWRKGAIPAGPPVFVCRQTGMAEVGQAVAAGDADLEVAFPVANRVKPEGDIEYWLPPDGSPRSSTKVRRAMYRDLRAALCRACRAGSCDHGPREYYLNDPSEVAPEEI